MANFERISVATASAMMAKGNVMVVDVRDEQSFAAGRLPGARHLDNTSVADFIDQADFATPVIVCCYHGNSSQGAAAFLNEKGFAQTYSMDGGFEAWRSCQAVESGQG